MVRKSRREPAFKMWLADHAVNDFSAQIWSLEARAASRDIEAMNLDERTEENARYALSVESRELRAQARKLKNRRTDVVESPQSEDAAWIL
jgi:hypothetical protein